MVGMRVGFGAALLIIVVGCGGEATKPVGSSPPASTTNASSTTTSQTSAEKKRGDQVPAVTSATPAKTGEVKSDATPSVASPEPSRPEPSPPEPPFQLEKGFTQLAFSDFEAFGAETNTWEATDDGVKCTGKPRGYLYSKQPYQNFTLRLDYRFPKPESLKDDTKFKGNTGFLIYVTGEHKVWPVSLEVQGKHVQMAAIKENGGAQPVTATDDEAARQKARRPVGQWNTLQIVSTDGVLSVSLNGTPVSKCEPDFLSEGLIGIQAEDHPFEVRRMRIRRE